jgi:hypothetical protein
MIGHSKSVSRLQHTHARPTSGPHPGVEGEGHQRPFRSRLPQRAKLRWTSRWPIFLKYFFTKIFLKYFICQIETSYLRIKLEKTVFEQLQFVQLNISRKKWELATLSSHF